MSYFAYNKGDPEHRSRGAPRPREEPRTSPPSPEEWYDITRAYGAKRWPIKRITADVHQVAVCDLDAALQRYDDGTLQTECEHRRHEAMLLITNLEETIDT